MHHVFSLWRRTFISLQVRNFRYFFVGQIVSLSGTWMQMFILGWLALQLSGSGVQLGIVVALQFIPLLFFGVWGGLMADRFDKRSLLFLSQTAFLTLALLMSALLFWDLVTMGVLYVYALGLGLVRVLDNPVRNTFASDIVSEEYVKNAVSLNGVTMHIARIIGPSIGGVLIVAFNIATSFLYAAVSYVVCMIMLYRMRVHELQRHERHPHQKGQIIEGLRYAWNSPVIKNTLLMMAVVGTFSFEFHVTLPLLAERAFMVGAEGYALLLSVMGAGAILGGLYSAGQRESTPRGLVYAVLLFGVAMMVTSLIPVFALAVAAIAVVGFFSTNVTAQGNSLLQLRSDPAMRGRVMSLWNIAMVGSTPIGGVIIGVIGEYMGARWAFGVGGLAAAGIALLALVMFSQFRKRPRV